MSIVGIYAGILFFLILRLPWSTPAYSTSTFPQSTNHIINTVLDILNYVPSETFKFHFRKSSAAFQYHYNNPEAGSAVSFTFGSTDVAVLIVCIFAGEVIHDVVNVSSLYL